METPKIVKNCRNCIHTETETARTSEYLKRAYGSECDRKQTGKPLPFSGCDNWRPSMKEFDCCGSCKSGNMFSTENPNKFCLRKEANERRAVIDGVTSTEEWHQNVEYMVCDRYVRDNAYKKEEE